MSRIGKMKIMVPAGVTVTVEDGGKFGYKSVKVVGPKGELREDIKEGGIEITVNGSEVNVVNKKETNLISRSLHGLYRTLINNMVEGVTKGFEKKLEIIGIGYKASVKGNDLELIIGYNHPILVPAPEGIKFDVVENVNVTVSGINKQSVGETAARVRRVRPPEPYRGKGIKYFDEVIKRKEGKAAASATTAA